MKASLVDSFSLLYIDFMVFISTLTYFNKFTRIIFCFTRFLTKPCSTEYSMIANRIIKKIIIIYINVLPFLWQKDDPALSQDYKMYLQFLSQQSSVFCLSVMEGISFHLVHLKSDHKFWWNQYYLDLWKNKE